MNFFFDEAGDFSLPPSDTHKVAIYAGIAVPEASMGALESEHLTWSRSLSPTETDRGEPKGARLRPESRNLFFEYLDRVPNIVVAPTILDLQDQWALGLSNLPERSRTEGLRRAALLDSAELRERVEKQARQIGNLHDSQVLRLTGLAHSIESTLRYAILCLASGPLAPCWETIALRIDRVATRQDAREAQIMRSALPFFFQNNSAKRPFALIDSVHTNDHPLVRNFDTEHGLDTNKMLADLDFVDSRSLVGVRVADVLANSLFLAASDLDNTQGGLQWYKRFMSRCPAGPNGDLGLILCTVGSSEEVPAQKYSILRRILLSRSSSRS